MPRLRPLGPPQLCQAYFNGVGGAPSLQQQELMATNEKRGASWRGGTKWKQRWSELKFRVAVVQLTAKVQRVSVMEAADWWQHVQNAKKDHHGNPISLSALGKHMKAYVTNPDSKDPPSETFKAYVSRAPGDFTSPVKNWYSMRTARGTPGGGEGVQQRCGEGEGMPGDGCAGQQQRPGGADGGGLGGGVVAQGEHGGERPGTPVRDPVAQQLRYEEARVTPSQTSGGEQGHRAGTATAGDGPDAQQLPQLGVGGATPPARGGTGQQQLAAASGGDAGTSGQGGRKRAGQGAGNPRKKSKTGEGQGVVGGYALFNRELGKRRKDGQLPEWPLSRPWDLKAWNAFMKECWGKEGPEGQKEWSARARSERGTG